MKYLKLYEEFTVNKFELDVKPPESVPHEAAVVQQEHEEKKKNKKSKKNTKKKSKKRKRRAFLVYNYKC